jgi:hypothetical protein
MKQHCRGRRHPARAVTRALIGSATRTSRGETLPTLSARESDQLTQHYELVGTEPEAHKQRAVGCPLDRDSARLAV